MSEAAKERFVLDTNQIVGGGTGWRSAAPQAPKNPKSKLLAHVAAHQTGLYCGKIIGEYLEKLVDRGHAPERAAEMIAYIMGAFERVAPITKGSPFPPTDLDDEVFLLCAIDGQAHYLVTDDKHLLELRDKYSAFKIGSIEALGLGERGMKNATT
ncbi:hypothetical protein IMCC26134_10465 [Verrucomicrobia bacterium IMCC26134]|nr:hypothetical protein IMCC26134_10465 [Verrucomicrobia bacterium IMCC26134]